MLVAVADELVVVLLVDVPFVVELDEIEVVAAFAEDTTLLTPDATAVACDNSLLPSVLVAMTLLALETKPEARERMGEPAAFGTVASEAILLIADAPSPNFEEIAPAPPPINDGASETLLLIADAVDVASPSLEVTAPAPPPMTEVASDNFELAPGPKSDPTVSTGPGPPATAEPTAPAPSPIFEAILPKFGSCGSRLSTGAWLFAMAEPARARRQRGVICILRVEEELMGKLIVLQN